VLLRDDETGSYWDHITGECLHGSLAGARLDEVWGIQLTTVEGALKAHPDVALLRSRPNLFGRLMGRVMIQRQIRGRGLMPWYFYTTMGKRDRRLPRMDQGLGVVEGERAVYYPRTALGREIRDRWGERELRVWIRDVDGIPTAEWTDGSLPLQLFTRWYGFSFTYPGCEIYAG
jgi:hypothetical protein